MSDIHEELNFMARFYRGPVFLTWLRALNLTRTVHGEQLTDMLGADGDPDAARTAEKWLDVALKLKLVTQNGPATPTHQQQFFGVGGVGYGKTMRADMISTGNSTLFWYFLDDAGRAMLETEGELRLMLEEISKAWRSPSK